MVESGLYTWSSCEQGERKCWLRDLSWSVLKRDCLGKEVRFAHDMVLKHSQKGK